MTEAENKPKMAAPDQKPDEVSLEQIDALLEADDPDFAQSLTQIKEVGSEGEVIIESAVTDDDTLTTEPDEEKPPSRALWAYVQKFSQILRTFFSNRWMRLRNFTVVFLRQIAINARVWPKEFFGYFKVVLKAVAGKVGQAGRVVSNLSWTAKIAWTALISLVLTAIILIKMSFGGIWLPSFGLSVETDLSRHADQSWTMAEDEPMVALFRALPQKEIEFLFPKVIVNLKRTSSHRNPMGAFEFFVVLDSQDVALEVQARRDELHDRLQRALEGQTYGDLNSPLGKKRTKDLLRRELNEVLSQGWVKEVLIKTMILKP